MSAISSTKQTKSKPSEAEIAALRAARAKKKADEAADLDSIDVGSHTLKYSFREHVVTIEEDWSGEGSALAGMQWLGGMALARMFDDLRWFPAGSLSGRRVMEVGAGCGLTSILLALLGANVTLTDMDTAKALPNVAANLRDEETKARLTVAEMDWYSPGLERFPQPFEIIVAGDCCYQPAVIEPLLRAMWGMSDASTEIYLCGIVSDFALVAFNEHVNRFFDVERLDQSEPPAPAPPALNSDDPSTRLRAMMRLHRRSQVSELEVPEAEPEAAE